MQPRRSPRTCSSTHPDRCATGRRHGSPPCTQSRVARTPQRRASPR
jgi:hypothetical protein